MPKELIGGTRPDEPIVKVAWQKDHAYVQLAVLDPKVKTGSGDGAGLYTTLGRGGINTLIRNLRRARDQAFGKDE